MSHSSAQITHESETQRQFVRLQLPASVNIEGNRFTVNDLSSGGMSIRNVGKAFQKGNILNLTLLLPFADFSLDVDLKAEIQHIDKKLDIAGCRFVDLNTNQISILNHVIQAFMAGDIVGADNIINVVARENFVNVRQHQSNDSTSLTAKIKKYSAYTVITLITLMLGFFIISNIMERLFIIKSPYGQVQASSIEILNPQSGKFKAALTNGVRSVTQGQIIGYIRIPAITNTAEGSETNGSQFLKILSPCDCFVAEQFVLDGEYSPQNASLFKLIEQNNNITVQTKVNINDVHRLNIGEEALIDISGYNNTLKGKISNILTDTSPAIAGQETKAIVIIQPEEKLPLDTIDRPAFVEFHL